MPKDELEEFSGCTYFRKYYRLKNGAFISLEDDEQKTIEWLVENSVGDGKEN